VPQDGAFAEIFRTTPVQTVCPNFYVLAHAHGCGFAPGCSYCYLKADYYRHSQPEAYTNIDDMLCEVRNWIRQDGLESHILNTGNLSDSLSFEAARPVLGVLIELFRAEARGRPHALLVVTKGGRAECAPLFEREACPNVIVSFSVNSPQAAADHEAGTAPVRERLETAQALRERGWRIRLRIDPMILGYDYTWIIGAVRDLGPERVTLGSLRAEPDLLPHVNGLFRDLEASATPQGLARYPLALRLALYRPAVEALSATCSVGLCEETPDVWDALGLDRVGQTCNCNAV
jgi:spore photoproduct lyase